MKNSCWYSLYCFLFIVNRFSCGMEQNIKGVNLTNGVKFADSTTKLCLSYQSHVNSCIVIKSIILWDVNYYWAGTVIHKIS